MHTRGLRRSIMILVPAWLSLGIALAGGCTAKTPPASGVGGDGFGGDLPAVGVGLGHTVSSTADGTLASTTTGMGGSGGAGVTTSTQAAASTGSGSTTSTASSTAAASSASSTAAS